MIMRFRLSFVVGVFLCIAAIGEAQAAKFSGSYLVHVCGYNEGGGETVEGGHIACQAYIAGVVDYHNLIRSLGSAPSVDFCIPEGVDVPDLQSVVLNYLKRNFANHDQFTAAPGVALALYEKYPC